RCSCSHEGDEWLVIMHKIHHQTRFSTTTGARPGRPRRPCRLHTRDRRKEHRKQELLWPGSPHPYLPEPPASAVAAMCSPPHSPHARRLAHEPNQTCLRDAGLHSYEPGLTRDWDHAADVNERDYNSLGAHDDV